MIRGSIFQQNYTVVLELCGADGYFIRMHVALTDIYEQEQL